jgi:rhodanese-related sulfurtransferase
MVQFDSTDRPGGFHKSMLVYTNINENHIRLIIKGYVISTPGKFRNKTGPLDISSSLIDFRDTYLDTTKHEVVTIFNSTIDTISITSQNKFDNIELSVVPHILAPGESGEIEVTLSTTQSELGRSIVVYDLEINQNEQIHQSKFSILYNVIEDFSLLTVEEEASPPILFTPFDKIDLGIIELNKLETKIIEIENQGKRKLVIHNIVSSNRMYKIFPLKQKIEPGEKGTFQLNIEPTIIRNNLASKLTIISNDPARSVVSFSIVGKVDMSENASSKIVINGIQISEAEKMIKSFKGRDELVILDVRTEDEYNDGCLEDAVNIDFNGSNFRKMLKLIDKSKTYLVYCQSGIRSRKAIEQMSDIGFKNIYHMHEGIEGWKAKRLKLVDPNI